MTPSGRPIYLDYASTTPVHPKVWEAMEPYLRHEFGNPSNLYRIGRRAALAIDEARAQVAGVLGCHDDEVVFTSGGSDSDNLALKGIATALRPDKRHVVTTAIEHSAVLGAARALEEHWGIEVTRVPVGGSGIVDPAVVLAAMRPDTGLVSVMLANNEIGTIQPVAEIARGAASRGARVHTDAVQAAGLLELDVDTLGVDALSLSAHKFYAPKGVGVLYLKRGTPLVPSIHGGGQEGGRRAGTENVAGIVGCGTALALVERHRPATAARLTALRDRLIEGIRATVPGALLNGDRWRRLPGNANFCLGDVAGESLLLEMEGEDVYASSGSACHAGSQDPSHVLLAIGRTPEQAHTAVRLTLGAPTTEVEVDRVLALLPAALDRLHDRAAARG
jgi:cysteine desulfurase